MQWMIDIVLDSMVGMVVAWYGLRADIPDGWQACNGQNGTPDLRDRFIFGCGPAVGLDDVGGTLTHTHAGESQHHHEINSGKNIAAGTGYRHQTLAASNVGETGSADTLPPYLGLWYIMKMPRS